jgi:hypothetical protein
MIADLAAAMLEILLSKVHVLTNSHMPNLAEQVFVRGLFFHFTIRSKPVTIGIP